MTLRRSSSPSTQALLPFMTISALGMALSSCSQLPSGQVSSSTQPTPMPSEVVYVPPMSEAVSADSASIVSAQPSPAPSAMLSVIPLSGGTPTAPMYTKQRADIMPRPINDANRDNYQDTEANPIHRTEEMPVATLSIDTDTGSYANVRRYLKEGHLPPTDAVRIEEMVNYFNADFRHAQQVKGAPFVVTTALTESPWDATGQRNQLLKVGIKAVDKVSSAQSSMPPANLVFLVDVSGSMGTDDKLPLAKSSLRLLAKTLRAEDTISIVSYSGSTEVVLPATAGDKTATIERAIDRLSAGGSTNGEDALKLAYQQAAASFKNKGINRILMLTDGDFNVGVSDVDSMIDMVKMQRDRGISLSTIGFGRGNLNDYMMEQIADNGNGNYSYIDSLTEAKKVLGDERAATFNTVAHDVKVQLEFNPRYVSEWRLIGYENRVLDESAFNNDKVDAGELGAGKSVVALFELTPRGEKGMYPARRYDAKQTVNGNANELGFLKFRYKDSAKSSSKLISLPLTNTRASSLNSSDADTRFSVAVAGFAQRLQGSPYVHDWRYQDSGSLAQGSLTSLSDPYGLRREFVQLTELADALTPTNHQNDADK